MLTHKYIQLSKSQLKWKMIICFVKEEGWWTVRIDSGTTYLQHLALAIPSCQIVNIYK